MYCGDDVCNAHQVDGVARQSGGGKESARHEVAANDTLMIVAEKTAHSKTRKPSLEVAPTTLALRTRQTTNTTSRRNVHRSRSIRSGTRNDFSPCDFEL